MWGHRAELSSQGRARQHPPRGYDDFAVVIQETKGSHGERQSPPGMVAHIRHRIVSARFPVRDR